MSATNSTPNYELPIFTPTDKPTWQGDWNGAMEKIDTAIKQASETGSGGPGGDASEALLIANEAKTLATEAKSTADTALTTAESASSTASSASQLAQTVANSQSQMNDQISENTQDIDTIQSQLTTLQNNVTKAQTDATNAGKTATEAKTAAQNAQSTASSAQTTANQAKTTADSVNSKAETAQTTATQAILTAQNALNRSTPIYTFNITPILNLQVNAYLINSMTTISLFGQINRSNLRNDLLFSMVCENSPLSTFAQKEKSILFIVQQFGSGYAITSVNIRFYYSCLNGNLNISAYLDTNNVEQFYINNTLILNLEV